MDMQAANLYVLAVTGALDSLGLATGVLPPSFGPDQVAPATASALASAPAQELEARRWNLVDGMSAG